MMMPVVKVGEPGVERGEKNKRLMMELGVTDRELQANLPVGERIEVTLRQRNFWMFKKTVGELVVVCLSPLREILKGETPKPLGTAEVNAFLGANQEIGRRAGRADDGRADVHQRVYARSPCPCRPDREPYAGDGRAQ